MTSYYTPPLSLLAELGFANWCDGEAFVQFGKQSRILIPTALGPWHLLVHGQLSSQVLRATDDASLRLELSATLSPATPTIEKTPTDFTS